MVPIRKLPRDHLRRGSELHGFLAAGPRRPGGLPELDTSFKTTNLIGRVMSRLEEMTVPVGRRRLTDRSLASFRTHPVPWSR